MPVRHDVLYADSSSEECQSDGRAADAGPEEQISGCHQDERHQQSLSSGRHHPLSAGVFPVYVDAGAHFFTS